MLRDRKDQLNGVSVRKTTIFSGAMNLKLAGFIIFILLISVLPAMARDVSLLTSLDITGEYNDNILFSHNEKKSDYLATLSPGLTFDYSTELISLNSYVAFDISRYADKKIYDNENQSFGLKGNYRLSEKMTFKGDISYRYDTTLDSYLEETGNITLRQDLQHYRIAGGFSYKVSGLSSMGIDYAFRKRDYELDESVDYDRNRISLSFNRRLKSERDVITIQSSFSRLDSDYNEVDDYGLSAGWSHQPSERYSIKVRLGGRYTRVTPHGEDRTNWNSGGTADISLQKKGEVSSIRVAYRRELNYSSSGEAINVDRIYCNLDRQMIERLSVRFRGNFYRTESERKVNKRNNRYFTITPSLIYQITEKYALELAYNYSWQKDKALSEDVKRDRNRVWITLSLNFPSRL